MPTNGEERPAPDADRVRKEMGERDERVEEAGEPEADDLDQDPAYNPDDPGLKDIKGG
jgi:hypothetical protein